MVVTTRPVLRYHGGKWNLAPWIIDYFPPHRVYVEPFGGAASVLMRKPRAYAEVYNDMDGEIVNLFRVLRESGEDLARLVSATPFARDEYRLSFEVAPDTVEQARRTVVRSFMGFGSNALCRDIKSGFRANSNRSGTTPAHDWANYPDALVYTIERLQGVVIENRPAVEVIAAHDSEETLFYLDPPYVHETRSTMMHGNHGYAFEMTDDDHRELADVLHHIRGMAVISGYECELYDQELYPIWQRIRRKAFADGAKERTEILWLSPNVPNKQPRLFSCAL